MQQNIEFERCIDFLVRMIDKYGAEVLRELSLIHIQMCIRDRYISRIVCEKHGGNLKIYNARQGGAHVEALFKAE